MLKIDSTKFTEGIFKTMAEINVRIFILILGFYWYFNQLLEYFDILPLICFKRDVIPIQ